MNFRTLLIPSLILAAAACDSDWTPDGHVQSETTQLLRYDSCRKLETDLKQSIIHEAWANIEQAERWRTSGGGPLEDGGASGAPGSGDGGRQEGVDYSGTNNQESGVDEADNVKTDGFHLYAINGNRLHIFGVPQFGQLTAESVTQIEGHPNQMLLHKDANRVVVFSAIEASKLPPTHPLYEKLGRRQEDRWYWRMPTIGKVTVLDITDRAAPKAEREFYYEGYYQTARRIDSSIRMVSYASLDRPELWGWYDVYNRHGATRAKEFVAGRINALSLADLIPQIYARTAGGRLESSSLTQASCSSFYRPSDSHARGISSIMSFDLTTQQLTYDADHVISNWATFYASKDRLVLAENAHDWWWYWWFQRDADQLNIHVFDISQAGTTSYIGSGRVKGQIIDQFAIDEEAGRIRVATTTNPWARWWRDRDEDGEPEISASHVWVLERDGESSRYATVGHLGGIAPGERITSARFLGDKGFLVTFLQIDPLFTVDLKDPTAPRLAGELKVPGFSTYLHPIEGEKLLSIGVGGDAGGANWRTTISMFDVSNFDSPQVSSVVPIAGEQGWGWSEALWEHKAFSYFAPKKLLAVPQSTYDYKFVNGRQEYRYLSKLELINVDPATGLTRKGAIDHTAFYQADPTRYWVNVDIRRSIFMGDFIYAISDKAITVHRLGDLGQVAAQPLPGYQYNDWWWGPWGI
jgi:Beta propeller domain